MYYNQNKNKTLPRIPVSHVSPFELVRTVLVARAVDDELVVFLLVGSDVGINQVDHVFRRLALVLVHEHLALLSRHSFN